MGVRLSVIATKHNFPLDDLIKFVKKRKDKYDLWEVNGNHEVEKPRFLPNDFRGHQRETLREAVYTILEMFLARPKVYIDDESIEIVTFSRLNIESWEHSEIISLMRNLGYERDMKKSRDIFWKIGK